MVRQPNDVCLGFPLLLIFSLLFLSLVCFILHCSSSSKHSWRAKVMKADLSQPSNTHTHTHSHWTQFCARVWREIYSYSVFIESWQWLLFSKVAWQWISVIYDSVMLYSSKMWCLYWIAIMPAVTLSLYFSCFYLIQISKANVFRSCFWCLRQILVIVSDFFHHGQFWSVSVSFSMTAD